MLTTMHYNCISFLCTQNAKTEPESSPPDNNGGLEIDWGDLGGIGEGEEPSGDIDFGDGDIEYDISLEQVDLTGITIEDGGNSCK